VFVFGSLVLFAALLCMVGGAADDTSHRRV
jgi:hypothetical protein